MTSDNIDIVEYLRRNAVFNHRDTYIAAANEIDTLRAENKRFRDEIKRLRKELEESERLLDEYQREAADRTRWEEQ